MLTQYEKLKDILRDMFQMDQADLDFGIYRIMNAKRDECFKSKCFCHFCLYVRTLVPSDT